MKKVFLGMLLIVFVSASMFGCATLGWKPSEDQLLQYESNLNAANLAEMTVFVVFDTLCTSKVIPDSACISGYAADKEWSNAYSLAMGAIADYRAGVSSEEMMKKYITEATAAGVRIVKLIKEILSSKPATAEVNTKAKEMIKK